MNRYNLPSGIEGEYEPGSRKKVLRNLLGIKSKREIDQCEFEALLTAQQNYLLKIEENTRFSSNLLCEMHHDWLAKIYEWAGRYRTVDMSKGGFKWPPAYLVESNILGFEEESLKENTPCKSGSIMEVSERIAIVHADFLMIHPFRDGNGRLARWLADLMSLQAGLPAPKYNFKGKGSVKRNQVYLNAVLKGYEKDYQALTLFFADTIERALKVER